jgi:GTPase SAR1 family protein
MKATAIRKMNVAILGAGDSGKSTFLKQISFKYLTDFTSNAQLINNLRDNIIFSAKELMELAKQKNVKIPDSELLEKAETLTPEVAKIINELPKNKEFCELLAQHGDSLGLQGGTSGTEFLFNNAVRISEPDYKPTDDDTCWARAKTTGIEKVTIDLTKSLRCIVYDIGGQRSERKKWPKIFNNIGVVVFMAALNEYDMVLEEDEKKNRLHESLKIWEKLTKSPHFETAQFILLFNKCDIFEKKIQIKPLNVMFATYDDFAHDRTTSTYETSYRFIEDLFKKRFHGKVQFETLVTNSTDKEEWGKSWEKISAKIEEVADEKSKCEKSSTPRSEKTAKRRNSASSNDGSTKSKESKSEKK